ncbi:MAG: hypothetical protein H6718_02810 [Polyangiaceae bacterium]|nr:hypothetical protein [Myxococcales bacterium]MCB9584297.1 hypothetical protein [Polyangiaceae bacterium]
MIGRLDAPLRRTRYASSLISVISVLAFGCGPAPAPASQAPLAPPVASAAPTSAAPSALPSVSVAPPSAPPPVLTALEPHFAPSADLNLEFEFPVLGQLIPSAKAAKYKIHLQLDGQPKGKRYRVALRLDDNQPHVVDPKSPIELGKLLDADMELTAGEHVLFGIVLDEAGEPWMSKPEWSRGPSAIVRFGIDSREVTAGPLVRVLSPRGTFNGDASVKDARMLFSVYPPLGRGPAAAARIVVSGEHGEKLEQLVKDARPFAISGLQNGDYRFEVQLLGSDGKPLDTRGAVDSQTITVNLDAPK